MVPISPTAPLHLIPSPHDRKDDLPEIVRRTDEEAPAAVSGPTWLPDIYSQWDSPIGDRRAGGVSPLMQHQGANASRAPAGRTTEAG